MAGTPSLLFDSTIQTFPMFFFFYFSFLQCRTRRKMKNYGDLEDEPCQAEVGKVESVTPIVCLRHLSPGPIVFLRPETRMQRSWDGYADFHLQGVANLFLTCYYAYVVRRFKKFFPFGEFLIRGKKFQFDGTVKATVLFFSTDEEKKSRNLA